MLKRITLNIDLDDNELLDESVREAIKAQAKQISREEMAKELEAEIARIVGVKLDEIKGSSYYSSIINRITERLIDRLDKEIKIDTAEIDALIDSKVNAYLDKKFEKTDLDSTIERYVDNSIASILTRRIAGK